MGKRGQVTLFIILSISLIIGGTYYLLAAQDHQNVRAQTQIQMDTNTEGMLKQIGQFVESCLEETSAEAISVISYRGGHYIVPEHAYSGFGEAPLYVDPPKEGLVPSLPTIEGNVEQYVLDHIDNCLLDFEEFTGFSFTKRSAKLVASLNLQETRVSLSSIGTLSRDGSDLEISQANIILPYSLQDIYASALGIIESRKQYPHDLCLDCYLDVSEAHNVTIEYEIPDDNLAIFTLYHAGEPDPIYFSFAVRFEDE
jgi:hypothetical protein